MDGMEERSVILIVDDAPINIKVLNEVLKDRYRVLFATNGRDALRIATEAAPDLILMDILMPEMDGYEVCRAMNNDPGLQHIPVIFITAMSNESDETIGLELGAVDYITKPFRPAIVRLRVQNHLEMKRQRDLLSRLSFMDGLTGLANRRAFDDRLEKEWRRCIRSKTSLSLLMFDIDRFKAYNDAFGHLAGDDCLKRVAAALSAALNRAADFIARYGGEEFVCLLPDTDGGGARTTAERMLDNVAALQMSHAPEVAPFISVSGGVATVVPSIDKDPAALIAVADRLLYRAKEYGRNRVESGEGW